MSVRNRLKSYRHKLEFNQTQMAEFLGINRDQYNRYENNRTQPSLEIALKISERLGVPANEIFFLINE
jgi:putative transcriptional regulator